PRTLQDRRGTDTARRISVCRRPTAVRSGRPVRTHQTRPAQSLEDDVPAGPRNLGAGPRNEGDQGPEYPDSSGPEEDPFHDVEADAGASPVADARRDHAARTWPESAARGGVEAAPSPTTSNRAIGPTLAAPWVAALATRPTRRLPQAASPRPCAAWRC